METSKLLAILLASSLTFAAGGVAAKGSEKAQKPEKLGLTSVPSMILAREASEGPRGGDNERAGDRQRRGRGGRLIETIEITV